VAVRVPDVALAVPLKVLGTLRTRLPVPACVRLPVPLMPAVLKSVPCVTVLLRLKTSVPLSVMALARIP